MAALDIRYPLSLMRQAHSRISSGLRIKLSCDLVKLAICSERCASH